MYDIAIIGAGPAGIVCAKAAVHKGFKTVLIERENTSIGGTCLNKGCIPTKLAMEYIQKGASWQEILVRKSEVLEKIKNPLLSYLTHKGLEILWGNGSFIDKNSLEVGKDRIEAKYIIIAGGSSPKKLLNYPKAVLAEGLFNMDTLPQKVLIMGAGYIGIEFASLLNSLGKEVCVVEKEEQILLSFDYRMSNRLRVLLETKGIKINTGKTISDYDLDKFDMIILATGREPDISSLNLEAAGITLEKSGWIKTDKFMRTNINNIYACGDITGKKMLAYIAEYQADICIKHILGHNEEEDYSGIPEAVFSLPQMAKVGILESEAKEKGINYRIIKSNFLKFSSAVVYDDTDGFIQLIIGEGDMIIGASVISKHAAEFISILSLCVRNKLTLGSLKKCSFIHPTLSEISALVLKEY